MSALTRERIGDCAMGMGWSDESFCERVVRRCAEIGKSQRWVLKEAQCAHDYLQTNPTHGRRIDRIARIAEVLELPLGDMLGLPVNGQIQLDLLVVAYDATLEATQLVQNVDKSIFCETLATIYNRLLRRRADGHDVHDPEYLKMMIEVLRDHAATRQST
jgi:hypothetical protein